MIFKVCPQGFTIDTGLLDIAYLIADAWNDWFKYRTMYTLHYVDTLGNVHFLGGVKIGEFDMTERQYTANIPMEFNKLGDKFFSLGQDEYYYENIKQLGEEIRNIIFKEPK